MEEEEISKRFVSFLRDRYYTKLLESVKNGEASLSIDFQVLDEYDSQLTESLLYKPVDTIRTFEDSIKEIDVPLSEFLSAVVKQQLRLRFFNLPEFSVIPIRNLRAQHIGQFVSVEGTVRRASEILPAIVETTWLCPKCRNKTVLAQQEDVMKRPVMCDCGYQGKFDLVEKKLIDTRWITVEEPFELTEGERPSQLNIFLREDLTSLKMRTKTDPGNRLKITGVLKEVSQSTKSGKRSVKLGTMLEANHVESTEVGFDEFQIMPEEEQKIIELSCDPEIYEKLIGSIAPSTYGLREIKEALAMQLFSGVPHVLKDEIRIRGDIHILITGDPSTGKSQILKLVARIANRGKYVSGKGVTGVGLCTTGDSLVITENGKIMNIGELVGRELEMGAVETKKGVYVAKTPTKRKIYSFDSSDCRLEERNISQYWKIKAPSKLVEIEMRSGRKIRVTEDNPIPVARNGEIEWTKSSKVIPGEFIPTIKTIKSSGIEERALLYRYVDKDSHLLNCANTINVLLGKIKSGGLSVRQFSRNNGINENSLYHFWKDDSRRGKPTLNEIETMCNCLQVNPANVLPDDLLLSQFNGHRIRLPLYLTEDLMYMIGLIAGDGSISKTKHGGILISFGNDDEELMNKFSVLCGNIDIDPNFYKHPCRIPYYRFGSKIFGNILKDFGITCPKKARNLKITEELSTLPDNLIGAYFRGLFDTDGYVAGGKGKTSSRIGLSTCNRVFARGVQLLLNRFGITSKLRKRPALETVIRGRKVVPGEKFEIEIRGKKNLILFKNHIGFGSERKMKTLEKVITDISKSNTNVDVIPHIGPLIREARISAGFGARELYGYKNYSYEKGRRKPSREMLEKLVTRMKKIKTTPEVLRLEKFLDDTVFWDEVKSAKLVDNNDEWVYDVTVEGEHSFAANGIIIHNTASVVKDEQFMGGWVLEAGAVVLCNKGLCSIDEFEKMHKDDQVALHEAMEQQSVSVAKATIVASLPAKTSILAAANPKLGRFDPLKSIHDQIDIPETLLSRFDLKFALMDIPNVETDTKMAEHILRSMEPSYEKAIPVIDPKLLRKYVAYARKNCSPTMPEDVGEMIKKFYLDMRSKSMGRSTISITARQFEALRRLSEASAKVRLSPVVTAEDANRAIRLLQYSLQQLGLDRETGLIDIDRAEGGISSSQRNKIRIIIDIIDELTREIGKVMSLDDIISAAEQEGISASDAIDVIDNLKRDGQIIEPKFRHIQKV